MIEDGVSFRVVGSNRRSLVSSDPICLAVREHRESVNILQEETQGDVMRCKVADEPVVVMKSRPVKPGNGVEDKIEMTRWFLPGG